MEPTAQNALGCLDEYAASTTLPGTAFAEIELLRGLMDEFTGNLFQYVHLKKMQRPALPEPGGRGDVLELTHDVFFASNFGLEPLTGVDTAAYAGLCKSLLDEYVDDLNVSGELLMCCHILGLWDADVQDDYADFVTRWSVLTETEPVDYHAVLVGGLLFKMLE